MDKSDITITDVVIEAMPFSDEIIAWCHQYPNFKKALKVGNADRFHALGMVLTSYPKNRPTDYVIGFVAYDMKERKFKQDFIVDVGDRHEEFVLYTKLPSKKYDGQVKHINEFFTIYGRDGNYADTHHFNLDYLLRMGNNELSERAIRAVKRSEEIIRAGGRRFVSQEELQQTLVAIREQKSKDKS